MEDNEKNIFETNTQNLENHNESTEQTETNEAAESMKNGEEIKNTDNIENIEKIDNADSLNEINFVMKEETAPKKEKKKHTGRKRLVACFVAVALIASTLGGLAGGAFVNYYLNPKSGSQSDSANSLSAQQVSIDLSDNIYYAAAVAEKAQKTVVGITTDITQSVNTFFGPQTQKGQSMGSGFIVDSNGYILTNAHVIGDGQYDKITVSLIDGSTEEGKALWYDTTLDLAVIKIEKTGLPAVDLGDSDSLIVGEPVVAIGNPMTLELERTVTDGIISGLNRSITFENGTTIKPLIQTNASINSGNSGGPLFNAKGEVIGINTAKMSSAEGLGFSIPINTAKTILSQVIGQGTYSTLYVGIKGVDVKTYESSLSVDLSAEYGVVVIEAVKDSPATDAGLKAGDVITAIDGTKIETMSDLKRQLYQYKENDKIKLSINRGGEEITVEMTLKVKPADY